MRREQIEIPEQSIEPPEQYTLRDDESICQVCDRIIHDECNTELGLELKTCGKPECDFAAALALQRALKSAEEKLWERK